MVHYKNELVRFMPRRRIAERERAFFIIFSTIIGAVSLALMLSNPVARRQILDIRERLPARQFQQSPALPQLRSGGGTASA